MSNKSYSEKLKDPRWQKKRLEILDRDEFSCQACGDTESTLNVHHRYYINGLYPWEYNNSILVTLCNSCHDFEHSSDCQAELMAKNLKILGFFNSDICELTTAFSKAEFKYPIDVYVSAISKTLTDRDALSSFMKNYFKIIKDENESKNV